MHQELYLTECIRVTYKIFQRYFYIDYDLIDLSVSIIAIIFVRISKTNRRRRQNGERCSREGKSAAKYRLKDCQYPSRPFLHHLPFCRRKRNFPEKERENEKGIGGKSGFLVFFLSVVSLFPLPIYRPPPSRPFSLFCRTSFPPLEINYSTFFSHHYTPTANNQGTRLFFSKSDRHLAFRLRDPRSKSSLKPAGEIERRVTN